MSGAKILEGLEDAIAGGLSRVSIDGQVWARATDLYADQQEIMRINNALRVLILEARPFVSDAGSDEDPEAQRRALDLIERIDAAVK